MSRVWIDKGFYLAPREIERGGHSYMLSLEYQVFELDGSTTDGSYRGPGSVNGNRLIVGDVSNPNAFISEYMIAGDPTSESKDYYQGFLAALDDRRQAVSGKLTKAEGAKHYYAQSNRWWEGYNDAWREKRENAAKGKGSKHTPNGDKDNQGRDLDAVKRHFDRLAAERRAGEARFDAAPKAPKADWTEFEGVLVLRVGNSRYIGAPSNGRKTATRFDVIDIEKRELVVQLKRDEVFRWLSVNAENEHTPNRHDRLPGGRADDLLPEDFDQEELARGTEHELEHTDDPVLAREIAMDHLAEDERYYERLDAMERQTFRSNSGYYVWVIGRFSLPLESEGPYGPHDLQRAKTFARIAATEGNHDRAVSLGRNPKSPSFKIVRQYRAGTGERVV